ncbi:MAG: DUF2842 domain-containing protein [Caulobacter sp.]|nr:DUF2842 domain-containing protein [Caulobacter sp.]
MNPRIRKLVGLLAMLVFLFVYVVVAVNIAGHLPKHPAISLLYFAIVGIAWGVPLFPLLSWMNREPGPKA